MDKTINSDYSAFLQQEPISHSFIRNKLQYVLGLWKNYKNIALKHHSVYLFHFKVHAIEYVIIDLCRNKHLWKLQVFLIEEQKYPNQIALKSKMPGFVEIHQLRMDILIQ